MENRHKRFQQLSDHLRASRTALHPTPTSDIMGGANQMGRHRKLCWGDPRHTTHLVASHQPGLKNLPEDSLAGSPPEQEE